MEFVRGFDMNGDPLSEYFMHIIILSLYKLEFISCIVDIPMIHYV